MKQVKKSFLTRIAGRIMTIGHGPKQTPMLTEIRNGLPQLHRAVIGNQRRAILVLLQAGSKIDSRDVSDRTPLHYAAYYGHAETAKLLLDKGADILAQDRGGRTPLHLAAENGHSKVVYLLHSYNKPGVTRPAPGI